ncbi:hypothetical protein [Persephonella sp.]
MSDVDRFLQLMKDGGVIQHQEIGTAIYANGVVSKIEGFVEFYIQTKDNRIEVVRLIAPDLSFIYTKILGGLDWSQID